MYEQTLPASTSTSNLILASSRNRKERTKMRGHDREPWKVGLRPPHPFLLYLQHRELGS